MVNPQRVPGAHTLFLSGNDANAKTMVRGLVESFGWRDVIDLGDITTAWATEKLRHALSVPLEIARHSRLQHSGGAVGRAT